MKLLAALIAVSFTFPLLAFGGENTKPLLSIPDISGRQDSETYYSFTLPDGQHTVVLTAEIARGEANILFSQGASPDPNAQPEEHFDDRGRLVFRDLPSGDYRLVVKGVTDYAGLSFELSGFLAPNIVLFLHGLAGGPESWDRFLTDISVDRNPVKAAVIFNGGISRPASTEVLASSGTSTGGVLAQSMYFYRLNFGAFDRRGGVSGADGKKAIGPSHGDYETYEMLGAEVRLAVKAILAKHPFARILLVGHSRGGLAGRAFLQGLNGKEKQAIAGFLTLGTPHGGSYFGRINPYLARTPRWADGDTWDVRDLVKKYGKLDCLVPSVFFLATGAVAINNLESRRALSRLPKEAVYQTYQYNGLPLGALYRGFAGTIFGGGPGGWAAHVSDNAQSYMVGTTDPDEIDSDGIVHSASQTMTSLLNLPSDLNITNTVINSGVFHTEEHDRTSDILSAMASMLNWQLQ